MKHLRYFETSFSDSGILGKYIKYIKHDIKECVCQVVGIQNGRFKLKMLYIKTPEDKNWRNVLNTPTIFFRENEKDVIDRTGKIVSESELEEIKASVESNKYNL